MNIRIIKLATAFILMVIPFVVSAQDCLDYHKIGDCAMDRQKGFKVYSQSKSVMMSPRDTVQFNVVFYGQKDYIFSFCTHKKLYPIHFRLVDPDTGDILYDNANDRYIESLGVGFDVTTNMIIKIDVLARKASETEIDEYVGCVGLLLQYQNYPEKKVKLQM